MLTPEVPPGRCSASYTFDFEGLPNRPDIKLPKSLTQHWFSFTNASTTFITVDNVCRPESQARYTDYFGWLDNPGTYFVGNASVSGRPCAVWALKNLQPGVDIEMCVADGTTPVAIQIVTGSKKRDMYFGSPMHAGPPPAAAFDVGSICEHPPPPCPDGRVESLEATVFHPKGQFDIAGQDVGDTLGDTMFLCIAGPGASSAGQQYSLVSRWELQVWSGFGQYALCNGYPPYCIGQEQFLVGRETALGYKNMTGQCADNDNDFGSWYSLSAAGQCHGSDVPDGKTCTWKAVRRTKTVDITCEAFDAFFDTCKAETALPFARAAAALDTIFKESDVKRGGCPAIPAIPADANASSAEASMHPGILPRHVAAFWGRL